MDSVPADISRGFLYNMLLQFSVLISLYRQEQPAYLKQALCSAFEQTYRKECWLGLTLREGLQHCSYEFVVRMDTDDVMLPDRFEKQLT